MYDEQVFRCHVDEGDGIKVTYDPAESETVFVMVRGEGDHGEHGEHICLDPTETVRLADFLRAALADMGNPRFVDNAQHPRGSA